MRYLSLLCLWACSQTTPQPQFRLIPWGDHEVAVFQVNIPEAPGLSGLAAVPAMTSLQAVNRDVVRYFTTPERGKSIVTLAVHRDRIDVQRIAELVQVPFGVEVESIAPISRTELALGTESTLDRNGDRIVFAELRGARWVVHDGTSLLYSPFGIKAESNRGVEAVCWAAPTLVAAAESVVEKDGKRLAPLGLYDRPKKRWRHLLLPLTTDTGKIAGLSCRRGKDGTLQLSAIERHFGVARILRVDIPKGAGTLKPIVALDLAGALDPLPNLEGIEWLGGETWALISDDQYGGKRDQAVMLIVRPRGPKHPTGK